MVKTYVVEREVFPAAWRAIVGADAPVIMTAVILAHRKADVAPPFTDRGLPQGVADDLTAQARLARELPGLKLIAAAGIPTSAISVLAWESATDKKPIVRVDPAFPADGATFRTVGRWRRVGGEVYVEALGEAGPCPRCDSADYYTFDRQDDGVTHHVCQDCGYDSDHATHDRRKPEPGCTDCRGR